MQFIMSALQMIYIYLLEVIQVLSNNCLMLFKNSLVSSFKANQAKTYMYFEVWGMIFKKAFFLSPKFQKVNYLLDT